MCQRLIFVTFRKYLALPQAQFEGFLFCIKMEALHNTDYENIGGATPKMVIYTRQEVIDFLKHLCIDEFEKGEFSTSISNYFHFIELWRKHLSFRIICRELAKEFLNNPNCNYDAFLGKYKNESLFYEVNENNRGITIDFLKYIQTL